MKNTYVFVCKVLLGIILCASVFWLGGCRYPIQAVDFLGDVVEDVMFFGSGEEFSLPGETEAERRRRWARIKHINRQNMQDDIEKVLLLDKPSRLTKKRIP